MPNIGTIAVLAIVVLLAALALRSVIRDRKNGCSSCGCKDCALKGNCRSETK